MCNETSRVFDIKSIGSADKVTYHVNYVFEKKRKILNGRPI